MEIKKTAPVLAWPSQVRVRPPSAVRHRSLSGEGRFHKFRDYKMSPLSHRTNLHIQHIPVIVPEVGLPKNWHDKQ